MTWHFSAESCADGFLFESLKSLQSNSFKSLMALSDETSNSKFQTTEERRVNIVETF